MTFVIVFFFLGHTPRSNRRTDSYAEWLKWHVSAQGRSFRGSGRWVTSYGENIPPNLPKRGVLRFGFQAKTQNLYIAISPELLIRRTSYLRSEFRPRRALRDMTSYFSGGCSDLDEIRQPDAEWHAVNGEMVEIETGSRIPIRRTFVFRNQK